MAKGTIAKEKVISKIASVFGSDYIGEFDKKLYVWCDDGGQKIQIALSLTCPKVYRGIEETGSGELNFEDEEDQKPTSFKPAEITKEETDTLAEMMAKFGL